jgi:hypothetical protein
VGRVGFGFEQVGSDKFAQQAYRVMSRVRVNLIRVWSGFGSNILWFFQVSGRVSGY